MWPAGDQPRAAGTTAADRRFIPGFLGAVALFTAVYYLAPRWRAESWALIGLSAVAAMLLGIGLHRPARRAPWFLLLAALSIFVVTDAVENVLAEYYSHVPEFPSISDDLALLAYPLATVAFLLLIRRQNSGHDWVGLLDALTLAAGLALLAWIYLIDPAVQGDNRSWLARTVAIAYPLGDVILLVVLTRSSPAGAWPACTGRCPRWPPRASPGSPRSPRSA
jgi:hypothetical protein